MQARRPLLHPWGRVGLQTGENAPRERGHQPGAATERTPSRRQTSSYLGDRCWVLGLETKC
jgi:hypothetical protein